MHGCRASCACCTYKLFLVPEFGCDIMVPSMHALCAQRSSREVAEGAATALMHHAHADVQCIRAR